MLGIGSKLGLPIVLLIDDDMVSREVTATMLTLNGNTVHSADGGQAALQMLTSGQCDPQIVLMDMLMPGLSGAQLIEQLRAHTQARIYAVSASRPPDDILAAADGFLLKPFGLDALQKLLEQRTSASAESATESAGPVLKAGSLAQFREIMSESAVREFYFAVITDIAKRIAALEAAFARNDMTEVRRIGHAIKGGCGMAGAVQLAQIGTRIEAAEGLPEQSQALLNDLRAAARNLESMLVAEFPSQGTHPPNGAQE